ncbi:MAG: 3-deoxy-7-phosphoheptulonate synthase [Eubacteriales bacterium]|nr:3-deoxy-7-phosphoheptulonate synthase [Eubacteriales bacterium]MDD4389368.1 3-deoxy-7-phosphoheptulonate synthase [Eubacteriales bacterium]
MQENTNPSNLMVSREYKPKDTVITIGEGTSAVKVGGDNFFIIAGPCTVESPEMVCRIAEAVKHAGATILRGGAFKPRTSPYSFQGNEAEGLKWLAEAKKRTGLPVVSEITSISQLHLFNEIDILQVGSRNMQNYELLKALGKIDKPVLLKRGVSASLTDFLLSAEYIVSGGNPNVILCERGIRTFERETRNTPDIAAIPLLRQMTHLPVISDPSHSTGLSELVSPLALAATAAGAEGIMIEVHDNPKAALCDGRQSITPPEFELLIGKIRKIAETVK